MQKPNCMLFIFMIEQRHIHGIIISGRPNIDFSLSWRFNIARALGISPLLVLHRRLRLYRPLPVHVSLWHTMHRRSGDACTPATYDDDGVTPTAGWMGTGGHASSSLARSTLTTSIVRG
jgi:hypothetical protein